MSEKIFIYKELEEDRDCVKYIEIDRLGKLECGHYFPSINLTGACFSCSLKIEEIDFDNIQTILSKEDFETLQKYNKELNLLGYGITQGDERYIKGIQLFEVIKPIIDKLESQENKELFNKIIEDEKECISNEYNLTLEEVEEIFDNYNLSYQDRGIVGHIYSDIDEASTEEAESLGYVTEQNRRYFDYEAFGNDLLESENYYELSNGNIVYYMY